MAASSSSPSRHFTISVPPSRSSSPAPSSSSGTDDTSSTSWNDDVSPGYRSTDVYDTTLPPWRAYIRRKLVGTVKQESKVIARMQNLIRTPLLDSYFVYSSLAGTHTFFMVMLPAFAFFGHPEIVRGLVMVLAAGVYFSSVLKDMFCSPRPFAPPVTRLTIGSHHLEYGFPSTHSTNSVSMALFFFSLLHSLAFPTTTTTTTPLVSPTWFATLTIWLAIYAFSIVFGRLYTAMHSFTDCIAGSILGASIWWAHGSWGGLPIPISSSNWLYLPLTKLGFAAAAAAAAPSQGVGSATVLLLHLGKGLGLGRTIEHWAETHGWIVPLTLVPLLLLAINQHPQPVDDCPCFEDAIAFGAVVLGALLGRWGMVRAGFETESVGVSLMPGSGWVRSVAAVAGGEGGGEWIRVERGWKDVGLWWSFAALKMVVGTLTIITWRILAKSFLHLILPPTFRLLARVFELPNRRFYTPATEYENVPLVADRQGREEDGGRVLLHAIPSVMDLSSEGRGVGVEMGGIGSGVEGRGAYGHGHGHGLGNGLGNGEVKMRSVNGHGIVSDPEKRARFSKRPNDDDEEEGRGNDKDEKEKEKEKEKGVKHYDADVLTKVIVYAGIAILAIEILPLFFEWAGWGLRSSPY